MRMNNSADILVPAASAHWPAQLQFPNVEIADSKTKMLLWAYV